jgi:hypothetical protein
LPVPTYIYVVANTSKKDEKILALGCIVISFQAFCQTNDTLLRKYDQQFIYRYGSSFMKGGNKLSFTDLRADFPGPSLSFDLYRRAKKR